MRVLLPIGSFYPSAIGGPSNTLYWHCKALHKHAIEVTVVTTNIGVTDRPFNKWLHLDCGKVKYCAAKLHYLPFGLIINSLKQLFKTDIVHLTSLFYPPSFLLALAGVIFRKHIVWSVRGELLKNALEFSSLKKKSILWFIRWLPKKKITFHVTSTEEELATRDVMGTAVSIVQQPNYIELPLKISKNEFNYLLFMGRIHPIKGLENLIGALSFSKLFNQSNYKLVIAGKGEQAYEEELKKLIQAKHLSDKVFFAGSVSGNQKQELYAGALVTILPSFSENFGNVVLESLCQGTPVIASTGTPWQVLNEKGAGLWVSNTEVGLAAAIDSILGKPIEIYTEMREYAYELATQNYNVDTNIDKWIAAYKKILIE
ncbi:MAG: glycosyltransferase [Flavihumibacter sp.]|nr:glycosyltransferase [Flavihumibacter sp.]